MPVLAASAPKNPSAEVEYCGRLLQGHRKQELITGPVHHVFTVQPEVKSSRHQINADCQFESIIYRLSTIVKATE